MRTRNPLSLISPFVAIIAIFLAMPAFAQTRVSVFPADDFQRPNTTAGGVGNGWVDASSKYYIASGKLAADPVASLQFQPRLMRSESLRDVAADLTTDSWVAGTAPAYRSVIRYINNSNFYIADTNLGHVSAASRSGAVAIKRMAGGITSTLATVAFPITPLHRYTISFSAVGVAPTTLSVVIYDVGEDGQAAAQPVTTVSAADSTSSLQAAGTVGLQLGYYAISPSGTSGIGAVTRYELFRIDQGNPGIPAEFPASDARVFYSPFNWKDGRTCNAGAYLKCGFSGTSLRIRIDTTQLANVPAENYPRLAYSVDNRPYIVTQLSPGQTEVLVATGNPDGLHQFALYYYINSQQANIWGTASAPPENYVRITGFALDPNAILTAPAVIRPKRMLIYGDSITRAAFDVSSTTDADSRMTYVAGLAAALDAEYGVIAHGGQGWNLPVPACNVPSFLQAWQMLDSVTPIDFSPPLDIVAIAHGRNGSVTAGDISGFLPALRSKVGPGPKIVVIVPFAGTNRAAINGGFSSYQSGSGDTRAFLIDPQTDGWYGAPSLWSPDGIHPNKWAQGMESAILARLFAVQGI